MANGDFYTMDAGQDPYWSVTGGEPSFDSGEMASSGLSFAGMTRNIGFLDPLIQGGRSILGLGQAETRLGAIAGRVVAGMGAGLAAKFPRLYAAIQRWRGAGVPVTTEKLWSLLRRFGPTFLITAGILTLEELTELMLYKGTHKRRRMNVLNPHALARSTRRLCGFERRAARVSAALGSIAGSRRRHKGRRCPTCKSSPCRC